MTAYEDFNDDVGLGEEDKKHVKPTKIERFTGDANTSYRVALMYFHPLEYTVAKALKKANPQVTNEEIAEKLKLFYAKKAEFFDKPVDKLEPHEKLDTSNTQFKKFNVHFKEGVGSVVSRLGKDGAEADKVWKALGDPKPYYLTIFLQYPTNKEGQVRKEGFAEGSHTILARLSNKTYETLHNTAGSLRENNLSIASQDLILKCTNKEFQNFDISAAGPALWLKNKTFASRMLKSAYEQYESMDSLFRQMSTADLQIKLGIGGSGGEDVGGGGSNEFDELLNSVV